MPAVSVVASGIDRATPSRHRVNANLVFVVQEQLDDAGAEELFSNERQCPADHVLMIDVAIGLTSGEQKRRVSLS